MPILPLNHPEPFATTLGVILFPALEEQWRAPLQPIGLQRFFAPTQRPGIDYRRKFWSVCSSIPASLGMTSSGVGWEVSQLANF